MRGEPVKKGDDDVEEDELERVEKHGLTNNQWYRLIKII